jgi:hypothetical protein
LKNPVETITRAEQRIARNAAFRSSIYPIPGAVLALLFALFIDPIGAATWERFGYRLLPSVHSELVAGLICAAALGLLSAGVIGFLAWRSAHGFVSAAEQVDDRINSKQEIVTLATLTDPSNGKKAGLGRELGKEAGKELGRESGMFSPLLPVLWRHASDHLASFDPSTAFPLTLAKPLRNSSLGVLALLIVLALTIPALIAMTQSPYSAQARRLREIARNIASSEPGPESQEFAKELRDTADILEDPTLPPEKKLEQLARVTERMENREKNQKGEQTAQNSTGKDQNGKGSGEGNGEGSGKGKGQGKGEGEGEGTGGQQKGKGTGAGSGAKEKGEKGDRQIAQLQKELSKAKQQIENQSGKSDKSKNSSKPGKGQGNAPKPGDDKDKLGGKDQGQGMAEIAGAKPDNSGEQKERNGTEPSKDSDRPKSEAKGIEKGDTHLGEFPTPGKFDRFYKAGEHGPPIDLKDARYVLFRIPPAASNDAGGKTVIDNDHATVSTPYANVPLAKAKLKADPNEQQLVPPRYRDLLQ